MSKQDHKVFEMGHTNLSGNRLTQILSLLQLQRLFYLPQYAVWGGQERSFAVNIIKKDTTRKVACALCTRSNHLCSVKQLRMRSVWFAHRTLGCAVLKISKQSTAKLVKTNCSHKKKAMVSWPRTHFFYCSVHVTPACSCCYTICWCHTISNVQCAGWINLTVVKGML